MKRESKEQLEVALLVLALAGLIVGLGLRVQEFDALARVAWAAGVVPVLAALLLEILGSLRHGEVGLDIVAALSMSAALFFGETLAAAVVAVMYAGGTFLESFAEGRARREMSDLLSRVPRAATRYQNGALEDVPLDEIAPGDRLLIRQGDIGDRFYVVDTGEFEIVIDGERIRTQGEGDFFGEIALLQDMPRTATVRALTDGAVWALDQEEFLATLTDLPQAAGAAHRISAERMRTA